MKTSPFYPFRTGNYDAAREASRKAKKNARRRELVGQRGPGRPENRESYCVRDDMALQIRERVQRVTAWHAAGCPEPKPNFSEE